MLTIHRKFSSDVRLNCDTMKKIFAIFILTLAFLQLNAQGIEDTNHPERTSFQTGQPWTPKGNLGSDVVMVYGIDTNLSARIQTWRDHDEGFSSVRELGRDSPSEILKQIVPPPPIERGSLVPWIAYSPPVSVSAAAPIGL